MMILMPWQEPDSEHLFDQICYYDKATAEYIAMRPLYNDLYPLLIWRTYDGSFAHNNGNMRVFPTIEECKKDADKLGATIWLVFMRHG